MISKVDAQALANFTQRVRDDWDYPGLMTAIGKCQTYDYAATAAALLRLAGDRSIRTPALLCEPGPHWGQTSQAAQKAPVMCPEHDYEKAGACRHCERKAVPPPPGWRDAIPAAQQQERNRKQTELEELADQWNR